MDHVRANEHCYLMTVKQVSSFTSISHTWVNFNKFNNQKQVYGQILVKKNGHIKQQEAIQENFSLKFQHETT